MNLREVSIGRSKNCDIYLDQKCQFASNFHGTIYYDGNQLMFRDTSTNGTMINNVNVHKRAVPIHRGDIIMIAGKYPVNWNQIDSFFRIPAPVEPKPTPAPTPTPIVVSRQPNLSKWNWGAFFLNWIWGIFNGCWWLLPIYLVIIVCSFIPIVNLFSIVLSIAFSVTCGVKGTEWAWENKVWTSVDDFEHTQSVWSKVAVGLFFASLLLGMVMMILVLAFSVSLLD